MDTLNKKLLIALLDFAQTDTPANVQFLALKLGLRRSQVADRLNQLAILGLLRAETMRLTFVGLMHAAGERSRVERLKHPRRVAA